MLKGIPPSHIHSVNIFRLAPAGWLDSRMLSGKLALLLVTLLLPVAAVPAATVVWNGPAITNASLSWSFAGNWTGGVPGGGDDVKFYDAGALPGISNVNNTVDAGIVFKFNSWL